MVFKRKFGNKEILIDQTGIETVEAALEAHSINIFNIDCVLQVLKQFGHLITKLKIYYERISVRNCVKINKILSEYSFNSLEAITLNDIDADKLVGLTGPFEKVEIVNFRRPYMTTQVMNMSQVFPMARAIHSTSLLLQYPIVIEENLPYLEDTNIGSLLAESTRVERQLQLNPQLRNLSVQDCNWTGLKMIRRNFPQLEHLSLFKLYGSSDIRNDVIHFENLKSFAISTFPELPDDLESVPIVFDNLEEIKSHGTIDKWIDIIVQNKQLRKITFGEISYEQFQRIIQELLLLEELWMVYRVDSMDDVNNIVRCIENGKKLKKISLWYLDDLFAVAIRDQLSSEWSMSTNVRAITIFTRNHSIDNEFQ